MNSKKILKYILFDLLGYAVCMGVFLLFFYLVPYELESEEKVVGNNEAIEENEFSFSTNNDLVQTDKRPSDSNVKNPGRGEGYDHLGTKDVSVDYDEVTDILNEEIEEDVLEQYEDDNVIIEVTKKEFGNGDDKVTYYVADVRIRNLSHFTTALAKDKYGTNIKDESISMAEDNDAILAITGDSYGNNDTGIVVRNGVLYRDDENDADVCVLFTDGTMETYTADEFDADEVWSKGVWQAWCFGPGLLDGDGNILTDFVSTTYLSDEHPRSALGYIEPGHYIFMVVDGRDEGYSRGVSLTELATLMHLEGCVTAFNLDGGRSASMVFDGEYVNQASDREISDIICIVP